MSRPITKARDLKVGISYTYIDRLKPGKKEYMGMLMKKEDFKIKNNGRPEATAILTFNDGEKINEEEYEWDDTFVEYQSGGRKRKSRHRRKRQKTRKGISRKKRIKSKRHR
jgi:hypothetical protein